jgi:hypothetical protein
MVVDASLAPSAEIHEHLVGRLGDVLRRPGMYGNGEFAAQILIDALLLAERRPELLAQQQRRWEEQGAWNPLGVAGACQHQMPGPQQDAAMSVYAEFARGQGWLRTDRQLDAEAYRGLRVGLADWTAQDRSWPDVRATFGRPSLMIGGRNPAWSKTLCYAPADPGEPMVIFHLWNEPDSGLAQPVLLAVRVGGDGPFAEQFAFTPEGRRRRPAGS